MTGTPGTAALLALHPDAWAVVVRLARPALVDLPPAAVTPALTRLTALPTSRLAGGRGRTRLAEAIAAGGPLWVAVRRGLGDHDDVLAALETAPAPVVESLPTPRPGADRSAEIRELRDQVRALRAARDAAERRADAAEARAVIADQARQDLVAARREDEAVLASLRSLVDKHTEERAAALDRERRRAASASEHDRQALREARRELDDVRRAAAASTVRPAPVRVRPEAPVGPAGAGRPTTLPDVMRPSREIAKLLVAPGRVVLVDGWNVSQRHRGHLDRNAQRQWLTDACRAMAGRQGAVIEVYFDAQDGPRPEGSSVREGPIRVIFPPHGISADDDIDLRVAAAADDEPFTVVTDDRELRARAGARNADVLEVDAFVWLL